MWSWTNHLTCWALLTKEYFSILVLRQLKNLNKKNLGKVPKKLFTHSKQKKENECTLKNILKLQDSSTWEMGCKNKRAHTRIQEQLVAWPQAQGFRSHLLLAWKHPTLTTASASSLGATRFNFTGVVPTGDEGGDFTGPEGSFLCVKSWFCLVSLLLCSILLFVGKLEDKIMGEILEEEFGNFRKALPVKLAWGGGLSRSLSPFSVFFTFMLVLVELPSNTMRGLFLKSTVLLLKSKRRVHEKYHMEWQINSLECKVKTNSEQIRFIDKTTLLWVKLLEMKFSMFTQNETIIFKCFKV